jgi:alpha-galactosidase
MAIVLSNRSLSLSLSESSGEWSVHAQAGSRPLRLTGGVAVHWLAGRQPGTWSPEGPASFSPTTIETPLGEAAGARAAYQPAGLGLTVHQEWAVLEEPSCLLWRLRLESDEGWGARLRAVDLLTAPRGGPAQLAGLTDPAAFITGWQSFAFAGALGRFDRYPRTRLGRILIPSREPPGRFVPRSSGRFLSEMFAVIGDRRHRQGLLVGALSEHAAFSSLDIDLRAQPAGVRLRCDGDDVPLAAGRPFVTDWAYLEAVRIDDPDPMGPYLEAAARVGQARDLGSSFSGWCSWYRWFDRVDESAAHENLEWLAARRESVPLDVFLLDDGYERTVGDWHSPWRGFPAGLPDLANKARQAGLRPGLWMAPFAANASSEVVRDHPDWILRDESGRPIPIGLVGNMFPYALDSTHPQVLDHLSNLVSAAVHDWGFQLLKLDFLYAAAMKGRHRDPSLTRAQAFRSALGRLREAAGQECWIIGCGCPFGPAIGLVDSLRVSPDVAPHWHPHYRGVQVIMHQEATVPAVRNSARNAVNLAPLHRRWWVNDPDCILLRPEPSGWGEAAPPPRSRSAHRGDGWAWLRRMSPRRGLLDHEIQSLVTIDFLTGGSVVDSDHLPELETADEARLARLLPPLDARPRVVDWFDTPYPSTIVVPLDDAAGKSWLLALVNWGDRPACLTANFESVGMEAGKYHALDLWRERYLPVEGANVTSPVLPPHSVFFVSLRAVGIGPIWVGDTFHLASGRSLVRQDGAEGRLRAVLALPRSASGRAWVAVPRRPTSIRADGQTLEWTEEFPGIYSFASAWSRSAEFVVQWSTEGGVLPSDGAGNL